MIGKKTSATGRWFSRVSILKEKGSPGYSPREARLARQSGGQIDPNRQYGIHILEKTGEECNPLNYGPPRPLAN